MATLVAGSYEKFIWGFSFHPEAPTLKSLFSYPSHTAPIKSVAASGPIAASGGADDSIKLYDLSSATEVGTLLDHNGAVTALAFYTPPSSPAGLPRNLLSASDDGAVCIFDADPFVHLKSINVHRKGVTDLAVHPSGRAAITVGRDCSLALINLVRGRRSFSCRLDREASIVRYECGDGGRFFMVSEERITVHDSEDAKMIHELNGQKRVLCVAPGENGVLFTSGEDRCITAWDTASGKNAYSIENAHQTRVKGLVVLKNGSMSDTSGESNLIASASSDGVIRVWDARMIAKDKPNHLAEADTKSRLTCLAGSSKK
ncbi:p21-activated protein kinase-interacting protein 1-like isoform X2 [Zingiber officinale]|nr:p21-activated protein kinase-interacting protein 1-like isoform X2 [Zingiber officinale]